MKQGEIWNIDLSPTIGAEIKKKRTAVIINHDAIGILPLRVIVPLTHWKDKFQGAGWMVKLDPDSRNNLKKPSAADCFQVRSVSTKRFLEQTGSIPPKIMTQIKKAVKLVIDAD